MHFFQVPTLKHCTVVRLGELLWCSETIGKILYKILPKPQISKDLKKDQLQDVGEVVRNNLSDLEIPATIQLEIDLIIEPIGWQLIDWINNLNYEFYGSNDHQEIYAQKYYMHNLIWSNWGIIDKKASVEQIIKNTFVSNEKCYELACIFCCDNQVSQLWQALSPTVRKTFISNQGEGENLDLSGEITHPLLVYWTCLLEGQTNKIVSWVENNQNINEYLALWAIKNNNQEALLFFWGNLTEDEKFKNIVHFADVASTFNSMNCFSRDAGINKNKQYLYVNDFAQLYTNINAFFLLQLGEEQITEILTFNCYNFLIGFFLHWLWHDKFLEIVNNWDAFNDEELQGLMIGVIDKKPSKYELKRYKTGLEVIIKRNTQVFRKCVLVSNCRGFWKLFITKDSSILKLLLNVLSSHEKMQIVNSNVGVARCSDLIMKGEFDYLDVFLNGALVFEEDKTNFRRNLFQSKDSLCNYLLLENKFDWLLKFVAWSQVTEEEVEAFKNDLIDDGHIFFIVKILLVNHFSLESMSNFVSWCFSSTDESISNFKLELLTNDIGNSYCAQLLNKERPELAKDFLQWCGKTKQEASDVVQELINEYEAIRLERAQ